jgi:glycosyltransferase involved in cell wall biosynthesis
LFKKSVFEGQKISLCGESVIIELHQKARPLNRSISIIVPAYNEQARLPETLRRIEQYFADGSWAFHEILVVDDGSTDGTVAAAEVFAASNSAIRVLRNPGNRGKGYAVRHGMLAARGEWCLFTDADLSAPIEEVSKLWEAVIMTPADIAIGSRALDRSLIGIHQPGMREWAGKLFNAVMKLATGLPFADTQCGFKLFRRDTARDVFSRQLLERFGFDVEILFIAARHNYRIKEVPVRWNHAEGSKVGMFTGLHAFTELAQIRLNSLRGRYDRKSAVALAVE